MEDRVVDKNQTVDIIEITVTKGPKKDMLGIIHIVPHTAVKAGEKKSLMDEAKFQKNIFVNPEEFKLIRGMEADAMLQSIEDLVEIGY